ncbi:DUF2321 domain-containing protein [Hyphomicrobium sp. 2TAF46]|uniref:DUF2321 domain-containing protein n=1 Tax=Hyphomicrobium sp. 2TAF46 TaxID=3233019 RepID=UPI003F93C84D
MGTYRVAQVCLNGHVPTSSADRHPELRETFCSHCGDATTMNCIKCNTPIRGDYDVEGVFSIGDHYRPPAFCHNCGNAFPWTERKISSAVELIEAAGTLSGEEIQQFKADLTELTKDSPKTLVASVRFKKVMGKVGNSIVSGVREIIVDVLSDTAKKAVWGS